MSDEIDALKAHVKALSNRTGDLRQELNELRDENQQLRDRITELETVVSPDNASKDFQSLTREEKVFRLRVGLLEKAGQMGNAKMNYRDVMHYFQNHPSPGHCYDLMRDAANADGYDYNEQTGEKRIVVDSVDVNDETLIHAANKELQEQPA